MGANSKKILSAVIGTLIAGAATTAVANEAGKPVFYGNFNVSVDVVDAEGAKTSGPAFGGNADHVKVTSNNSRIGFTHELALEHGLKALVKAEVKVNTDNGTTPFDSRELYLGVKGDFGQVIAGRINRPVRTVEGRVDQFNHLYGDINTVLGGESFSNNVVQYSAPKFGNTTIKAAYIAAEQKKNIPTAGEPAPETDGLSASVTYDDGKLYAAFGYEYNVLNASNGLETVSTQNVDAARLALSYNFGAVTLGAILQHQKGSELHYTSSGSPVVYTYQTEKNEEFGYVVNGAYTINKVKLKAQYGAVETERTKQERDYFAVGADYALGKGSYVFAAYTQINKDEVTAEKTDKIFQVGFNQAF